MPSICAPAMAKSGAKRHLSAVVPLHARRQCQKQWRKTGRIDCNKQGDERAENRIVEPHTARALLVGM